MLAGLVMLQLVLPLVLIAIHALAPSSGRAGFALRCAAIAALLLYLAVAGLWLFPPWWTPFALGLLLAAVTTARWRKGFAGKEAHAALRWAEYAAAPLAATAVACLLAPAFTARPGVPVVDLSFPLGPGTFLVLSGGPDQSVNAHVMTLEGERFAAYRGQSYGVDIIAIDRFGLRVRSGIQPEDPSRYRAYGLTVRAPCAGTVVAAVDGIPDMPVPQTDRAHMAGNHLIIACGQAQIIIGHLIRGSLGVGEGSRVKPGDAIGKIGNSGNSNEPHLHIHAQSAGTAAAPLSGNPMQVTFDGRVPRRNSIFR